MPHLSTRPAPSANGHSPEPRLRIVAADADPAVCEFYQATLPALGHKVLVVGCPRQAADLCRALPPDLLIADAVPPGLGDHVPVIVVSDGPPPDAPAPAHGPVLTYLAKPVHPAALAAAVAVAARLRALQGEVTEARQQLEDRKVIERAKGLVARYCGLAEEDAYTRMRRLASDQNKKLVEVAQAIIGAGQVLHILEQADEHRAGATNGPAHAPRTDHRPVRRTASLTTADCTGKKDD